MDRQRWLIAGFILGAGMLLILSVVLFATPTAEAGVMAWFWNESEQFDSSSASRIGTDSGIAAALIDEQRAPQWVPTPVADDLLVRMPGTQPDPNLSLEEPGSCGCHKDLGTTAEPFSNWQDSMMAQAGRDFLYWATMTVAGQDAIWAVGNPNAMDICLRCHMTSGWLAERSDPTNGSLMTGTDFDGVHCSTCHYMYDPFFDTTYDGTREGNDWDGYWDEASSASSTAALATRNQDETFASALTYFNGDPYYVSSRPPITYTEAGGGQLILIEAGGILSTPGR